MGTSITEGTVIAWSKEPGAPVQRGETVCEITTDKVDSDCPAPVAGVGRGLDTVRQGLDQPTSARSNHWAVEAAEVVEADLRVAGQSVA